MRLGLGSYSFRWALGTADFLPPVQVSLTDLVVEAGDLGVEVLQVADSNELEAASADALSALRDAALARDVDLQVGFTAATPERLELFLGISQALEADVVRVVVEDSSSQSHELRAIAEVAPDFEAAGVTLGIENHFTVTSRRLVEVVESIGSPAVGVVLDVANSIMCGEWPEHTVTMLAPYTVCLHLKDYRLEPDADGVGGHVVGAPLGTGLTDPETIFGALKDGGADLAAIVEQWSPRCETVEATVETERRWRRSAIEVAREWIKTGK